MIRLGPAQWRILECYVRLTEYGVCPPMKVIAGECGIASLSHGTIARALNRLNTLGLVERKLGCWRPTQAGITYVVDGVQQ